MEIGTSIHLWGNQQPQGTYLLQLKLNSDSEIIPGKLTANNPVLLKAGEYLYLGSALGKHGAPMARRILRHANRTSGKPQIILSVLIPAFQELGWIDDSFLLPDKKIHWHIDYVLESPAVEVVGIYLFSSPVRIESLVAKKLSNTLGLSAPIQGFGGSDDRGNSHFFKVDMEWGLSQALAVFSTAG